MPKAHKTYYGNVAILRAFCPDCLSFALIIRGKYACCDRPYSLEDVDVDVVRASESPLRRHLPGVAERRRILKEQGYRCIYCGTLFGSEYLAGGSIRTVTYQWDHFVPYSYSQDNQASNYVAACRSCNAIKYSMVFDTLDEARIFIIEAKIARAWRR